MLPTDKYENGYLPTYLEIFPSFQTVRLEGVMFCTCYDLRPGELYVPGCPVHDSAVL